MADTSHTLNSNRVSDPVAFDDRIRRVMELKKQIREGTYRSDPAEIAAAMVDHWMSVSREIEREQPVPSTTTADDRKAVAPRFLVARTTTETGRDSASMTA
ncbi:MAG: flagellar biosynthesis anti-sigma factor FlgM [bacterium]